MKGLKNVIYLGLTLGMLIYAVPQLQVGHGFTLPTLFGIIWIAFALLVIAAHLHELLGVDEETRRQITKIQYWRKWQAEQKIVGKSNR